jgi:hypothetical protein
MRRLVVVYRNMTGGVFKVRFVSGYDLNVAAYRREETIGAITGTAHRRRRARGEKSGVS